MIRFRFVRPTGAHLEAGNYEETRQLLNRIIKPAECRIYLMRARWSQIRDEAEVLVAGGDLDLVSPAALEQLARAAGTVGAVAEQLVPLADSILLDRLQRDELGSLAGLVASERAQRLERILRRREAGLAALLPTDLVRYVLGAL